MTILTAGDAAVLLQLHLVILQLTLLQVILISFSKVLTVVLIEHIMTIDGSAGGDLFLTGGLIDLKNDGSAVSQIKFYCESSNAHAQTLIGAPHSKVLQTLLHYQVLVVTLIQFSSFNCNTYKQNINKSCYKHRYFRNIYSSYKCRRNNIRFCFKRIF